MINAVLGWVSQDSSARTLRRNNNFAGLITARLKYVERHGVPQIPFGVDQDLMAELGVKNGYSLMSYMAEVSFICLLNDCMSTSVFRPKNLQKKI